MRYTVPSFIVNLSQKGSFIGTYNLPPETDGLLGCLIAHMGNKYFAYSFETETFDEVTYRVYAGLKRANRYIEIKYPDPTSPKVEYGLRKQLS